MKTLEPVVSKIKTLFPTHKQLKHASLKLADDVPNPTVKTTISGHLFMSEDGLYEIQLTPNLYNFKMHGNYQGWEVFKAKAMEAWNICANELPIVAHKRHSLRYINNQ